MASITEELDFKFYLICMNVGVDFNSHTWPVAIVLMSTALGIQNQGEEIHLSQGSKCYAVALPKSKVTGGFPERVLRKEGLAGGEVILNIPKYAGFPNSTVLRQHFGGD